MLFFSTRGHRRYIHSFPTRRSSDLKWALLGLAAIPIGFILIRHHNESPTPTPTPTATPPGGRSEEHTSELQSHSDLVCRLLLEKKKCSRRSTCRRRWTRKPSWRRPT